MHHREHGIELNSFPSDTIAFTLLRLNLLLLLLQSHSGSRQSDSRPHREALSVLDSIWTESGVSLSTLTERPPVLLVFFRHFGCVFCRQALDDVSLIRKELIARAIRPVLIHLGTPERARPYFDFYNLKDVDRVSDPEARIHKEPMFGLPRTHPLSHFFTPEVWTGWLPGPLLRYKIGRIQEDAYQMPGLFYLRDSQVVRAYRYRTIADRPDYLRFVS